MSIECTPIQWLSRENDNEIYVKREDLIPFSFGGNKARKAELFFSEIDAQKNDCVVTYGSSSSNHCRVVANQCARRSLPCYIVSPEEASEPTANSAMMALFGAQIAVVSVEKVHDTIENLLRKLKAEGKDPYFIPGGGHGNLGTRAYADCYGEIRNWETENRLHFDYIFHASGTGTTQAGLVCGQMMNGDARSIVGISIARKCPRGRDVVCDSVADYLSAQGITASRDEIERHVIFDDSHVGGGYGKNNAGDQILSALKQYGIPLDPTYTGKAFRGMLDYLEKNGVRNKTVLFIHTGGTPLFFDYLNAIRV